MTKRYRATLAYNARAYRAAFFDAESDEEARQKALTIQDWPALDCDANEFAEADCTDPIIAIDIYNGYSYSKTIEDEMRIPSGHPYSRDMRQFVNMVAALDLNQQHDITALIAMAKAVMGGAKKHGTPASKAGKARAEAMRCNEPGHRCPKCGSTDLRVRVEITLLLQGEAGVITLDPESVYWDDTTPCLCNACEHEGEVENFAPAQIAAK